MSLSCTRLSIGEESPIKAFKYVFTDRVGGLCEDIFLLGCPVVNRIKRELFRVSTGLDYAFTLRFIHLYDNLSVVLLLL